MDSLSKITLQILLRLTKSSINTMLRILLQLMQGGLIGLRATFTETSHNRLGIHLLGSCDPTCLRQSVLYQVQLA